MKNFSTITTPLTGSLKRTWGSNGENRKKKYTFKGLKEKLCSTLILCLPDYSKAFKIKYDALGLRLDAVLIQRKCSISYFSEKLHGVHWTIPYTTNNYVLVRILDIWQLSLLLKEFMVHTDYESIKNFEKET